MRDRTYDRGRFGPGPEDEYRDFERGRNRASRYDAREQYPRHYDREDYGHDREEYNRGPGRARAGDYDQQRQAHYDQRHDQLHGRRRGQRDDQSYDRGDDQRGYEQQGRGRRFNPDQDYDTYYDAGYSQGYYGGFGREGRLFGNRSELGREDYEGRVRGYGWEGRDEGFDNYSYESRAGAGPHRGRGPKGYRRSDERIREEVNDRLTYNDHLDATDIEVEVSDGEVTLNGSVDSRRAKRLAEDIAEEVFGVIDVHNRLRIERGRAFQGEPGGEASRSSSGQRQQPDERAREQGRPAASGKS